MIRAGGTFLLALLALGTPPLAAQTVPFGKNKIQYQSFDWHVLSGDHIDVYYYPAEQAVARLALTWGEESYAFLERKFQHHPFRRIPLIVYSSDQHFEQTNVSPGFIPEGVLGFTEYLKRRVALPFRGDYDQFRHTLRHELVHAFQLSKLAEVARLQAYSRGVSPQLIPWWTEGLAEYWSSEQSTEDEMFVRDLVTTGNLPTIRQFSRMYGYIAYPLGAELLKYLSQRFGDQYIVRMYEEYRDYNSFDAALQGILGEDLDQLSREWRYSLEQRFFPAFANRPPLDVGSRLLVQGGGANFKPVVYQPTDRPPQLLFLSPRSGYTNLYRTSLELGERGGVQTIVKGERSAEFESFHEYESGFDVNRDGLVALVSKVQENDALILWDMRRQRLVGRYQWPDLVGLRSPAWDPTGHQLVFEGLSTAGISDIYTLDFDTQQRTALTHDHYADYDPDWSPDGREIVFASDRDPYGEDGYTNLVVLELDSGRLRYLTYGRWHDQAPHWSHDGTRVAFTSDRAGTYDLYAVDRQGAGRRLTELTGGAFDPAWLPGDSGVVFAGFGRGQFRIFEKRFRPHPPTPPLVALGPAPAPPSGDQPTSGVGGIATGWTWEKDNNTAIASRGPHPYKSWDRFSIDFAGGEAVFAPGYGSAQGAQVLASDMIGNHIIFAGLTAVNFRKLSDLADSFSGQAMYLNLSSRLNYGAGIFRYRGLFRDVALNLYEDRAYGGFFLASYPFSKFRRVELQLNVQRSDRKDVEDAFQLGVFGNTTRADTRNLTRSGLVTSNYVSYVKDNTLWLPTGPIDGERYNITAGLVTCFDCSTPSAITGQNVRRAVVGENYVLAADYRRYFRTSLYSAYAIRGYVFFSDGAIPGRAVLGGTHELRGYPRYSLAGSRLWLVNQEWRFPLLDGWSLRFPFGNLQMPGVQGALFTDLGSSWLESQKHPDGTWGSYGLGFRTSLGAPVVLRLDLGRRFAFGGDPPVVFGSGERFHDTFVDFWFGYNY